MELNKTIGQVQIEAARHAASHVPAELLTSAATVVKAKEDWEGGPVSIWAATIKGYPGDAFDIFPDPASKEGDGSNNPCKFNIMEPSGKDGKLKAKEKDFYNIFADNLPPAVELNQRKDWLERLGNDKMKRDGIPPQFLAEYDGAEHSKLVARDLELTKVKNKLRAYRQAIRAGFFLRFQLEKVNELGGVTAAVVPTADGKGYENRIRVHSTMPGRELEDNQGMTVKAFMRLDPMTAFKNGATYQALIATAKREQGEGEGTAATTRITNADQARKYVLDLHDYFDTVARDPKREAFTAWVKFLGTKAGDDTFASLWDMREFINDVMAKLPKAADRRMELANAEQAAAA